MAFTITELTAGSNTADNNQRDTDSVDPTTGALLVVGYAGLAGNGDGPVAAGVTSAQGTWVEVNKHNDVATWSTFIGVYCIAANDGDAGAINVTSDIFTSRNVWLVLEVTGHDAADAIEQSAVANSGTGTTIVTLGASPASDSMVIGFGCFVNNPAATVGTDFTSLDFTDQGSGGSGIGLSTMYDIDGADTTADWTSTSNSANVDNVAVAFEVNLDGGGGGSILPLVACDMQNISDMGGMRG